MSFEIISCKIQKCRYFYQLHNFRWAVILSFICFTFLFTSFTPHLYSKTIFDTYGHYVRFWCICAYGAILCYRDCSFETFYQVYYDIYVTAYILQSEKKSINKQTHILPWSMHVFFELISSRTCVRSLVSRAICIGLYWCDKILQECSIASWGDK